MEFIQKNKVFSILCLFLVMCISLLTFQLINEKTRKTTDAENGNTLQNAHTQIESFEASFDKQMHVIFNWKLKLGKESIEKMEIYYGNTLLNDVTNKAFYSLNYLDSLIQTGNADFEFVVTLGDKRQVRKTAYLYLNEAFQFVVKEHQSLEKIDYVVSYYYEKNRSVNAPKVTMKVNQNISLPLTFISSDKIEEIGNFIKVNATYELSIKDIKSGNYIIDYTWIFSEYNLEYKTMTTFER